MTYSANEIINRAKSLADVANTDYISYEDALQYINDSYNWLYQLAINRGDDYFVRQLSVGPGQNKLPPDFYQLRSVNGINGANYTRLPIGSITNTPGYRLINNTIEINAINNAEVSYYPKPTFITLSKEAKADPAIPAISSKSAIYKDHLVYEFEDDEVKGVYVLDLKTEESTFVEYDEPIEDIFVANSYFVLRHKDGIAIFDFCGNEVSSQTETKLLRKKNGDLTTKVDSYMGKQIKPELETDYIIAGNDYYYYISDQKLIMQRYDEDEGIIIDEEVESFNLSRLNHEDLLTYAKNGNFYSWMTSWLEPEVLAADYVNVIGYTDEDVYYTDGVISYVIGNTPDTLLNFPTNMYFTLMSYQLATYFVAKQGGDVTLLNAQKEKAEQDFENDSRDAFGYVRIKNVY